MSVVAGWRRLLSSLLSLQTFHYLYCHKTVNSSLDNKLNRHFDTNIWSSETASPKSTSDNADFGFIAWTNRWPINAVKSFFKSDEMVASQNKCSNFGIQILALNMLNVSLNSLLLRYSFFSISISQTWALINLATAITIISHPSLKSLFLHVYLPFIINYAGSQVLETQYLLLDINFSKK